MTRQLTASQAIRLRAALLLRSDPDLLGFLLGLAAVAGVGAVTWANAPVGPATRTAGVIQQLSLTTRRCPCALVQVNNQLVRVREQTLRSCRVGDRIPLDRWKAPVGFRYRFPPGSCRWR